MSVHEGPQRIASGYNQYEEALADGMFLSDEPGFYKPDDFGIRIENDMEVVLANKSSYDSTQFLRFNTITFVPYELSLIDVSLLTESHIDAINAYHKEVLERLEPLLVNDTGALNALQSRTTIITAPSTTTVITTTTTSSSSSAIATTTTTTTTSSSSTTATTTISTTTVADNKTFAITSSPTLIVLLFFMIALF